MSFTPSTDVLLASGLAVPIASLRPGEKVFATNVRTGKSAAEPVAAVLTHYDANRYDLIVRTAHGTAVIHTTRNHLFWDAATHRWAKAGSLHYGGQLRSPGGRAMVVGGHQARSRSGWMWDLTIPRDHDFYVYAAADTAILAHNCAMSETERLAARVDEIHGVLDPIAQGQRTTAVMSTREGVDVLAGGARDLEPAQRALANEDDLLARLPGAHAEVTALNAASKAGLTPSQMAVSRVICPACQEVIWANGGEISPNGLGAVWP